MTPAKSLNKLKRLLYDPGSSMVTMQLIRDSFPLGEQIDMQNGAWIKCMKSNDSEIVLMGFSPKGYEYEVSHHDCYEDFVVDVGRIRETQSKIVKRSCQRFHVHKEITHGLKFLENTTWHARFYMKKD